MQATFDTSTIKGLKDAERYKARLENMYEQVNVRPVGLDCVLITGVRPIEAEDSIERDRR